MPIPLRLEIYDQNEMQHLPGFRNLRFAKAFQGGEDMWLSFDLERDIRINYPDVAYGNEVILRQGLTPRWAGEMRQIAQREEAITVNCLGRWVHADDWNYEGEGRLWCDSRYGKWKITTPNIIALTCYPHRFTVDFRDRLFIAPRKNEQMGANIFGSVVYECNYDNIVRVSFDFDCVLPANWELCLFSWWNRGAGSNRDWQHTTTGSGTKDITLLNPVPIIEFYLQNTAGAPFYYTGETGTSCYGEISNLRIWGQATESPSMIHVSEDIIDAIQAATPIDASHDLVQEQLLVRDTFTDNNGVLLPNHQPDVDQLRGGWAIDAGGFDIQANQANNTVDPSRVVINAGESDGVVCLDPQTPGAGNFGLGIIFRWVDANNYWVWMLRHTGDVRLRRYVGGVPTNFDTAIGAQAGYTYHLMVKLRGDLIEGYVGGILRYSRNDTAHQTATRYGIRAGGQINLRVDNFEVYQALPIWPMFYEDGESCYGAMRDVASFGDWNYKAIGWGVEAGGDRVYLREADRESVRYVIPREYVEMITSRGDTHREFYTEAWARYIDEEGMRQWTAKYYVHVTNAGLVVNTVATGDDRASVIYGVQRDTTKDFGRVDANLAVEYLIQYLMEHGHPQVKSTYIVRGPVKDLHRGGAWIDPVELEMGYLVQIPSFRAAEAEGAAGSDLRDWDTTFLLVGMEFDSERGSARLIPEGATEDLKRIIAYARAFQAEEDRKHISKRSEVIGG